MVRAERWAVAATLGLALGVACAGPRYEPYPLQLRAELPADAFDRCRAELLRSYGGLAVADADRFLLQSGWTPSDEPVGERRASVFRSEDARDLAVVVEFRWLTTPWFGLPHWTSARGDDAAERELAEALRTALTAAR